MAKLTIMKDIFDLQNLEVISVDEEISVKEFLEQNNYTELDYSSSVEVFDPDTGETTYIALNDDPSESMNVVITVNNNPVTPDYVLQLTDEVIIQALPASAEFQEGAGMFSMGLGVISMAAGVVAAFIPGAQGAASWLFLGGLALCAVGGTLYEHGKAMGSSSANGNDDDADSLPDMTGGKNEALLGNCFPLPLGTVTNSPRVCGSPYTEYEYSDEFDISWFGRKQHMYYMLTAGYAPTLVKDFYLDQLPFGQNTNNVISGILSYEDKEFGDEWNSNKIKMEISQFGLNRTIYPHAVIQKKVDANLIYCYDEDYKKIAEEKKLITWHGGSYPTGLRSNTIQFSESVPYKIAVGIDMPGGLYRHNTSEGGTEMYTKIPMNLAIQWRPCYKYVFDDSTKPKNYGYANTYHTSDYDRDANIASLHSYGVDRFGGWRNFKDSKIVKKIKYNSEVYTYYVYYTENEGTRYPFLKDGYYGYYINNTGYEESGTFYEDKKWMTRDECWNYLYKMCSSVEGDSSIDIVIGTTKYRYSNPAAIRDKITPIDKGDRPSLNRSVSTLSVESASETENTYHVFPSNSSSSRVPADREDWVSPIERQEMATSSVISVSSTPRAFANQYADDYFNKQGTTYANSHTNKRIDLSEDLVSSRREIQLNLGLSPDTKVNCNPDWVGEDVFAFGQYSCGAKIYEGDKKLPDEEAEDLTHESSSDFETYYGPKDEMRFEIEAELDQEDILDLLNLNPESLSVFADMSDDNPLKGATTVVMDQIEVRVMRLTPCYIDKTVGSISYDYADTVKWSYLKSYLLDKQKLVEDIQYIEDGKQFAKINCSDTYKDESVTEAMAAEGSQRWNNFNIADYYAKPLSDEDQYKMCTIAIDCQPDTLGVLAGSIEKISCTTHAVTPALKMSYIRYWISTSGTYKWYDSYDSTPGDCFLASADSKNYNTSLVDWKDEDENHMHDIDELEFLSRGLFYTVKDQPWDAAFFPVKVEPVTTLEVESDGRGGVVYDSNGNPKIYSVKNGNTWMKYIEKEMCRRIMRTESGYENIVATKGFMDTFTDQNSIAQALGFMVGQSLGKDAYSYNSLNARSFVRYWCKDGDAWYYCDTDDTVYTPSHNPDNYTDWIETSEPYYEEASRITIDDIYSYSMREVIGDFNMLSVKEAYAYTDKIDLGNGDIKFMFNKVISQQAKVSSILSSILSSGLAYWFYDEMGRIEIHNDRALSNPVLLLTDENVISTSSTRSFAKSIAGYHVTFQDENNGGQTGELYVLRQGQTRNRHTRDITELNLDGVTNNVQAKLLAQFQLAQTIVRREAWTKKLNHIGSALTVGSLLAIQGRTLQIGTDAGGRILQLIEDDDYIYGFTIDGMYNYLAEYEEDGTNKQGCSVFQPLAEEGSRVITLRFASRSQQQEGITIESNGHSVTYKNVKSHTNMVLLAEKISKETYTVENVDEETGVSAITEYKFKEGDNVAFGYIGSITSLATVYSITPDEKNHYTIVCYPYNSSIYKCAVNFPSYETNITKKPLEDNIPMETFEIDSQISTAMTDTKSELEAKIKDASEPKFIEILTPEGSAFVNGEPDSLKLQVKLNGFAEKTIKWYKDGTYLSDENEVTIYEGGTYSVTVTDTNDNEFTETMTIISVNDGGYQEYQFAASDSPDSYPTDEDAWHDAPPSITSKQYLWMRTRFVN